jgi:hypothetical protein
MSANTPLSIDNAEMDNSPSTSESAAPARPRAFLIEFKNVWQTVRFVVIATDVWQAMTTAEQEVERAFGASEYVYRPVLVKEIDAQVLCAPGIVFESEATE